ncbi:hypothetical protein QBC34DRAFT_303846 [Podospora aff. communis PSN243]|uniref:NADH dehydrogenase [ubiquinone] 1 alpha subcomplex assembly factor 3 n=1 Tax=Podospora aff. communis PSN243 TaxID=3040156 RepID=A0AAV9GF20_9PEZI|nr:hypothetical protein QBC34DRAFT_303846 [Podospora aff. communis PSN243]
MANPTQALRLPSLALTLRRIQPVLRPSATSTHHHNHNHYALISPPSRRPLHTSPRSHRKPLAHNKEPVPDQPPQTDFESMDVLGNTPVPATAVTTCLDDGFVLDSGLRIDGGAGALLVGGEAFAWKPWGEGRKLVNGKGQWEVGEQGFGVLGVVWPRPDLLILGLGKEMRPISPATRRAISALGMRVEVLDTRNAAAQFNLLATERGVMDVAAALIPLGWVDGKGVVGEES